MEYLTKSQISEIIEHIKHLGDVIMQYRDKGFETWVKDGGGKVTTADVEVNKQAEAFISTKFPDYGIVSEELTKIWKNKTWFIDPLNGTGGFIKGNDTFNILFGLVVDNVPVFGFIYHPVTKTMYFGGVDSPAQKIDSNGKITTYGRLNRDIKTQPRVYCPSSNWEKVWTKTFEQAKDSYRLVLGSNFNEYTDPAIVIIEQLADIYPNHNFGKWGLWDIAAGEAIIRSCGGIVTDFFGEPIDYICQQPMLDKGYIFASDKLLIDEFPKIKVDF